MTQNSSDNSTDSNAKSAWGDTFSEKAQPPDKKTFRDPEIGEKLGSGICKEKLGEGGMGRVYRIWSTKYEIERAIKLIPNSSNPTVAERFVREAKLSIQLNHPNIVLVYDYSNWNGFYYIEMEYIKGESLDYSIKRNGPFDTLSTLAIGIIICDALHTAHTHTFHLEGKKRVGLIHRDLKPGNIMLADNGMVKLMDFGIARPIGDTVTRLTAGNGIVGSYSYMPPEQLEPTKSIDKRVDIYALGTVLYEMVTGKPAFSSDNPYELKRLKTSGEYRPIHEIIPGILSPVEDVITKSIQVHAKNRYSDIPAFAADLTMIFSSLTSDSPRNVLENRMSGNRTSVNTPPNIVKIKTSASATRLKSVQKPVLISAAVLLLAAIVFLFIRKIPDAAPAEVKAPVPVIPADNTEITTPQVRFSWHPTSLNGEYLLQIALSDNFSDSLIVNNRLPDTLTMIQSLPYNARYYWRVRNTDGGIQWSDTGSFIFSGIISDPPFVLSPVDGCTITSDSITFIWKQPEDNKSVRFQLSEDSTFSSVITDTITSDTSIEVKHFKNGITRYWRIGSIVKGNGTPLWTDALYFTVSIEKPVVQVDTLALLRSRYKTDSILTIIKKMLYKNEFRYLPFALSKMQQSNTRDSLILRCAEKLFSKNKAEEARPLLKQYHLTNDAFTHLCSGKQHLEHTSIDAAKNAFEQALTAKTILDSIMVKKEALFYKANSYDTSYLKNKTEAGRVLVRELYVAVLHYYQQNKLEYDSHKDYANKRSMALSKETIPE